MQSTYTISCDKTRLDLDFIHAYLSTRAYWCLNIPYETVRRSVEHSLCFGVYCEDRQVGFARVITDYATIAYLGDVFVIGEHRGKGLSKRLMRSIMDHPQLQGLRRWILLTRDAHGLYGQFGWKTVQHPERYMEIANPNVYT
ncbi:MAG TPA: GNAT family N-acetyltransferase [Puia sp.]|nr:GNAT family N-acetyltransferase [Puia sp.]